MSYLYILGINPLSSISFANIFSHSVGCPFVTYRLFFFCHQRRLTLIKSNLFGFAFISFALAYRSKKIAVTYLKKCSMFTPRSFMAPSLIITFRFLIYFLTLFLYMVRGNVILFFTCN